MGTWSMAIGSALVAGLFSKSTQGVYVERGHLFWNPKRLMIVLHRFAGVDRDAPHNHQRDLSDPPALRQAAGQAVAYTQAILDALKQEGVVPAMPQQPNPQRAAATPDFLVTPENTVLFLEAGPGHFFGAHPCAFLAPDGRSVAPLEGLRLGSTKASIPLVDL